MTFNIYLARELRELQTDFEQIFEVDNLYHDYENVWEWLESSDRNSRYYLNISRPHNWEQGEYDHPIFIKVESNAGEELDAEVIAGKIKERLKCEVVLP